MATNALHIDNNMLTKISDFGTASLFLKCALFSSAYFVVCGLKTDYVLYYKYTLLDCFVSI